MYLRVSQTVLSRGLRNYSRLLTCRRRPLQASIMTASWIRTAHVLLTGRLQFLDSVDTELEAKLATRGVSNSLSAQLSMPGSDLEFFVKLPW